MTMAEQMLKQNKPLLSQIKLDEEFLQLKKINNQPLATSPESEHSIDNYLPFTPLARGGEVKTSTPVISLTGNGSVEDNDRFQIRNMDDDSGSDVETVSMETNGQHSSSPVNEHDYVKPINQEEVTNQETSEGTADKMETPDGRDESNSNAITPGNADVIMHEDSTLSITGEVTGEQDSQASVEDPGDSHEMECQTEDMSGEDSSEEEGEPGTSSHNTEASNVKFQETSKSPNKEMKRDDKGDNSKVEDTELTMLCETITRETLAGSAEEDGNEAEEEEEEEDDGEGQKKTAVKTKVPKAGQPLEWKDEYGSTRDLDGDPEMLRMPFKYGWKRELVIRGVYEEYSKSGQPKRKPADVYYFTPDGTKLRSKIMIANYLRETGSDMTQENFSFIRRPIYEPPQEVVRQAGKSKGRMSLQKSMVVSRSPGRPSTSPSKRGRKRKRGPGRPRRISSPDPPASREVLVFPPQGSMPPPEVVIEREGNEEPYEQADSPLRPTDTVRVGTSPKPAVTHVIPPAKKSKAVARKSTTQAARRISLSVQGRSHVQLLTRDDQLCGLDCPGRSGQPPDLQCGMCMCLFHPECVNFTSHTGASQFVCLRCQKNGGTTPTAAHIKPVVRTSGTWNPVGLVDSIQATSPKVSVIAYPTANVSASSVKTGLSNRSPIVGQTAPGVKTILIPVSNPSIPSLPVQSLDQRAGTLMSQGTVLGHAIPVTANTQPASQSVRSNVNLTTVMSSRMVNGSLTSPPSGVPSAPPKLTPAPIPKAPSGSFMSTGTDPPQPPQLFKNGVSVFNTTKPAVGSCPATPDSVISVSNAMLVSKPSKEPNRNGGQAISTPVPNNKPSPAQLLTLPEAVAKRLNLTQPLALKINNIQIIAPPSSFIKASDGVKVCLPPNTVPLLAGTTQLNMQVKVSGDSQENSLNVLPITTSSSGFSGGTGASGRQGTPSVDKEKSQTKQMFNAKFCYFNNLWNGFEAMMEIFSQLHVTDLLRARSVCKTWKKLISQNSLWQQVSLDGLRVRSWEKAVKFLQLMRTESLDLRGCATPVAQSDIIPQLSNLPLRQLYLGEMSSTLINEIPEYLVDLTELIVEVKGESGTSVDVRKICSMRRLRTLRFDGYLDAEQSEGENSKESGITAQGLSELAALSQLEVLSLTGISDIEEQDWSFLGACKHLRQLELRDCSSWNSSTFFLLGQCVELEVLKLRQGGELPDIGLADALVNLTKLKHLELQKWIIPHSLEDVLPELDNLRTLVITTDSTSQAAVVNRNTLSALWDLSRLQRLKWGITHSQNSTIILNDGGEESESRQSTDTHSTQTTQCIPFLSDDVSSDNVEQIDIEQMTHFVSIQQLKEKLNSLLPSTEVDVYLLSSKLETNGEGNIVPESSCDKGQEVMAVKTEATVDQDMKIEMST